MNAEQVKSIWEKTEWKDLNILAQNFQEELRFRFAKEIRKLALEEAAQLIEVNIEVSSIDNSDWYLKPRKAGYGKPGSAYSDAIRKLKGD